MPQISELFSTFLSSGGRFNTLVVLSEKLTHFFGQYPSSCAHIGVHRSCLRARIARAYIPSNFVFFAVTSVTHKEKKSGVGRDK